MFERCSGKLVTRRQNIFCAFRVVRRKHTGSLLHALLDEEEEEKKKTENELNVPMLPSVFSMVFVAAAFFLFFFLMGTSHRKSGDFGSKKEGKRPNFRMKKKTNLIFRHV